MSDISLVIIDDHPILRKGLRDLLRDVPGFRVVGEAENGARALELIEDVAPDIAIVDVDMPVMDGIDLVKMLRKNRVSIEIIYLTIHKDRSLLRSLSRFGVKGYVLKDSATEEIIDCVKAVAAGERFVSPKLERERNDPEAAEKPQLSGIETLTAGELRVLSLIALSRTNREIAGELFISVRTVETHRYNICFKLGLKGPHVLLKFAVSNKKRILNAHNLREFS